MGGEGSVTSVVSGEILLGVGGLVFSVWRAFFTVCVGVGESACSLAVTVDERVVCPVERVPNLPCFIAHRVEQFLYA